ncbi:MAG: LTA synthase family protein, partial [Bacilli bacterium]|nr:LTA synthase family protein [Bacilli bacterium]
DDFLVNQKVMPTTYKMMKNSINFTKHYSFTSGGGSTFNSEFMVNTGYSSAYHYNQSAYSFSRNNYDYSLPNLLRKLGYKSNVFHMNTSEYYSRGVNYKSFGFDNYYGLKDTSKYHNNTDYWLDRELIFNNVFNKFIFNNEGLSMSFIITYSAHMPYKTTRGTCSMLTKEQGLTEYECLKLQAKETDYFMSLLLENLEKKNMLDNTIIMAFTDHYLYTLEDKSLLDKYKVTENNLINKTPFFIWSNGDYKKTVKKTNSQLDILPTILNLFGIEYYSNYYIGNDILDPSYQELVFFPDGSWYDGKSYIANGEYQFGRKININKLNENNVNVKRKMTLNDAVMKSNYFNNLSKRDVN